MRIHTFLKYLFAMILVLLLITGCCAAVESLLQQAGTSVPTVASIPPTASSAPTSTEPAATAVTLPAGKGRIEGRVYDAGTGSPITNTTIVLIDATKDPQPPFGFLFNPAIAVSKVDAQGYFLFPEIDPSKYIFALQGSTTEDREFPFCTSGSTPTGWEALRQGNSAGAIDVYTTNMGVDQRFDLAAGEVVQKDIAVECK